LTWEQEETFQINMLTPSFFSPAILKIRSLRFFDPSREGSLIVIEITPHFASLMGQCGELGDFNNFLFCCPRSSALTF